MRKDVVAFEPLYRLGQTLSDDVLTPLDWQKNPLPTWREFALYLHVFREQKHKHAQMTGILSPKFKLKTGIAPKSFLDFVRANISADVVYINPFPQIPYFSYNVWMQGEVAHPGLTQCGQDLIRAAGLPWRLSELRRQKHDVVCYSNFWLGSQEFWEGYVGRVLQPIGSYLEANRNSAISRAVLQDTLHTDPVPYLPFIIERLFSTYLSETPEVSRAAWMFTPDEVRDRCVNQYERILVDGMRIEVRDADESGDYPEGLKAEMKLMCELWQQQFRDYFSIRSHPHTQRKIIF